MLGCGFPLLVYGPSGLVYYYYYQRGLLRWDAGLWLLAARVWL